MLFDTQGKLITHVVHATVRPSYGRGNTLASKIMEVVGIPNDIQRKTYQLAAGTMAHSVVVSCEQFFVEDGVFYLRPSRQASGDWNTWRTA